MTATLALSALLLRVSLASSALLQGAAGGGSMSGRPPVNALARSEPRLYDVTFTGTIFTDIPVGDATARELIVVRDAPIVLPMIMRSTWSRTDPGSLSAKLALDGMEQRNAPANARLDADRVFGMAFAVLPIVSARCQVIRFDISWRMQSWSSALDEGRAAQATWPAEWPAECADALKPQMFIESDDARFAEFVAKVSNGQHRAVPPHLAAKDLIRAVIRAVRVNGNGISRVERGMLQGMELSGALQTMLSGVGSPHDLVAACVATLRAAGIPARVVIGIDRDAGERGGRGFVSWAEYFLPGSGWVPFDPMTMRGSAVDRRNVRDPWPGLGTMRDLNQRIPLSFAFQPPAGVIAHGFPAVYGWDPRPSGAPATTRQWVKVNSTNRGPGVADPQ